VVESERQGGSNGPALPLTDKVRLHKIVNCNSGPEVRELFFLTHPGTPARGKKVKILEVCFSRALGGNELYVERIGNALAGAGHAVAYALHEGGSLAGRISGPVTLLRPRTPYVDLPAAIAVLRLVRRLHSDVVHVHTTMDLPFAAFAKTFYPGLRVVYTKQMQPGRRKSDPFHRWIYGKIDLLLAATEQMRARMASLVPIEPDRVTCLYLGTGLPDIAAKPRYRAQVRSRFNLSESDFLILFPNRLDPQKGQELIIEALARLKRTGLAPHVIFAGAETVGGEGYRALLQSAVERAGVAPQCAFPGFVEELGPLYAAADLVALATREETFGMVLIEGMAWATPAIGSDAGGVGEIIDHGKNGYLFATMDAGSLAGAIEQCMRERERLPEMGRWARATVEEKFSFDKHVALLEGYMRGEK
jgi:glycosyltransferase involved in cell wall biosynthesis